MTFWREYVIAALAVLVIGAYELKIHEAKNAGIWQERSRVADSTLVEVRKQSARVDTVYRRDTVKLTRTIARTDSLRDTLLVHLTDTLKVREFIAAADSTIHACTEVANTCATRLALKDQEIAALTIKVKAAPAALDARHWYSDRIACGPYAGIDYHGKPSAGGACQISLFRIP